MISKPKLPERIDALENARTYRQCEQVRHLPVMVLRDQPRVTSVRQAVVQGRAPGEDERPPGVLADGRVNRKALAQVHHIARSEPGRKESPNFTLCLSQVLGLTEVGWSLLCKGEWG